MLVSAEIPAQYQQSDSTLQQWTQQLSQNHCNLHKGMEIGPSVNVITPEVRQKWSALDQLYVLN